MGLRTALAFVMAVALLVCAAGPAQATIRIESTASDGLRIEDNTGHEDQVTLLLRSTDDGLEYTIMRVQNCGPFCFDFVPIDYGPGCREVSTGNARCTRLGAKITVLLRGANDNLQIPSFQGLVPITDPMTISGGTGSDFLDGGEGPDSIQGNGDGDRIFASGGDDNVQGGTGDDSHLAGDSGNDTVSGSDGNDLILLGTGTDTATGSDGNDHFVLATPAVDGKDTVNGGVGTDSASYSVGGSGDRLDRVRIIEGSLEAIGGAFDGSEGDVMSSIEDFEGGDGNDTLTGVFSGLPSNYRGAIGNDSLFGSEANNTLVGGAGSDNLDGNGGADVIDAKAGEGSTADADPLIDCGTGTGDLAVMDLTDDAEPTGCENRNRSPAGEGKHVRLVVPRAFRVRDGRIAVRLKCPRALKVPRCAGTLRVRIGRRSGPSRSYSIRRGRNRTVRVRLGSLASRVKRRTVGEIVSVERGLRGDKTTERRALLRG